jgi:hypothetical protein
MNVTSNVSNTRNAEIIHTYACRIARRLLLRLSCEIGHPVLSIEEDLVEMAQSRLQEYLITSNDPKIAKMSALILIKRIAASKILNADVDIEIKENLLEQINCLSIDDIIPQLH